ncbi:hypothetical protein HDU96_006222 [Phlyctochytrium bullatum]|nr:hypothetical protein HDU96_006222 [Phlyctochytrium bullatum]
MLFWVLTLLVASGYVAVLYVGRDAALAGLPRNDVRVIRHRMRAVTLYSLVAPPIVLAAANLLGMKITVMQFIEHSGINFTNVAYSFVVGAGLTLALFCGSLVELWFDEELPFQKHFSVERNGGGLMVMRTLVVGPITEELVFRGYLVPLAVAAGMSEMQMVTLMPLSFGVGKRNGELVD